MNLIDRDAVRQELVKAMERNLAIFRGTGKADARVLMSLQYAIAKLDSAPVVDAQPVRHGRFIGTEYDGYADGNPVYYEWKCSECGCVFEDEEPTYNYCPNCGAKMEE